MKFSTAILAISALPAVAGFGQMEEEEDSPAPTLPNSGTAPPSASPIPYLYEEAGCLETSRGNGNTNGEEYIGDKATPADCIQSVKDECPWANSAQYLHPLVNLGDNSTFCYCQYNDDTSEDDTSVWANCKFGELSDYDGPTPPCDLEVRLFLNFTLSTEHLSSCVRGFSNPPPPPSFSGAQARADLTFTA